MTLYLNSGSAKVSNARTNIAFLYNVETAVRRVAIIEVFKFISHSKHDQHRFKALLEKIKPYIDDKLIISSWENQFKSLEDEIKVVKILRNKIFAHRDSDFENEIEYNFKKVCLLIDNCRAIFNDIIKTLELDVQIQSQYHEEDKNKLNGAYFFEKYVNL